jgi:polyisoprenoid-binding protein YceI
MSMKNFIFLVFSLIAISSLNVSAQKKLALDKTASSLTYFMKHPMHDWDGKSKELAAVMVYDESTKTIKQVAATVKVNSFDSGNSNRDSHMVEVLESLKYPNISFSSSAVSRDGEKISADGNLTFHGITKSVKITGTIKESGKKLSFNGTLRFLLTDFKVTKPTLLGVASENEVDLKIVAVFNL